MCVVWTKYHQHQLLYSTNLLQFGYTFTEVDLALVSSELMLFRKKQASQSFTSLTNFI